MMILKLLHRPHGSIRHAFAKATADTHHERVGTKPPLTLSDFEHSEKLYRRAWASFGKTLLLLLLFTTTAQGMNPFAMPSRKPAKHSFGSPTGRPGSKQAAGPAAPTSQILAVGETPLEKEILALGQELETIAFELAKIAESKEMKQEIDKKRAARDKKSPGGKAGFGGGYRPGSYKPSSFGGGGFGGKSFGGSSPFGRSSGSSFGKSSPFGSFGGSKSFGGGFGSSGGFGGSKSSGSSFGGSGFGSSGSGGFGSSRGSSSSGPTFASRGSFGGDDPFSSSLTSSTPKKPDGPRAVGSTAAREKSNDEEATRAKAAGPLGSYVTELEKALKEISTAKNQQSRKQSIRNLPLATLNQRHEEAFAVHRTMKKSEQEELEKSAEWRTHADKLKAGKLPSQMAPFLVELMIPEKRGDIPKMADARTTFDHLDIGSTVSQTTLQGLVATRSNAVAASFKARAKGKDKAARAPLAEELQEIIDSFPADKLGLPTPPALDKELRDLLK